MEQKLELAQMNKEINSQLADKEVYNVLLATTFKDLTPINVKKAIMEGMIRGFTFRDFLEKHVYAIPFGNGYSLVTSIDYSRKIGMRSGIVGKSAPVYELSEDSKSVISCTVTVQRKVGEYVGSYAATVYFNEYSTGKNLWASKPRTMIAKVAEMHALRMACPEELSQAYIEEEFQSEQRSRINPVELKAGAPTMRSLRKNPHADEDIVPIEDENEPEAPQSEIEFGIADNHSPQD